MSVEYSPEPSEDAIQRREIQSFWWGLAKRAYIVLGAIAGEAIFLPLIEKGGIVIPTWVYVAVVGAAVLFAAFLSHLEQNRLLRAATAEAEANRRLLESANRARQQFAKQDSNPPAKVDSPYTILAPSYSRNEHRTFTVPAPGGGFQGEDHEVDFLGFTFKNTGSKTLKGCEVQFIKLEKGPAPITPELPTLLPYRPMTAAERKAEPILKRDIHPGATADVCICTIHDDQRVVCGSSPVPTWSESTDFFSYFREVGDYRFYVQISAIDEPAQRFVFTLQYRFGKAFCEFAFPPEVVGLPPPTRSGSDPTLDKIADIFLAASVVWSKASYQPDGPFLQWYKGQLTELKPWAEIVRKDRSAYWPTIRQDWEFFSGGAFPVSYSQFLSRRREDFVQALVRMSDALRR